MNKNKVDIGIVILHYNNIEDTLDCVRSFEEKIDTDSFVLLVFDNCSPNGSGKILQEKLKFEDKVIVYINDKNLGFGGGNNKAIKVLRETYDPKYLVLSNNDILLVDNHFYAKIDEEYSLSNFAELGPMILTADGRCDSNPIFDKPYYKDVALEELTELKRKYKSYKHNYVWLHNFVRKLKFKVSKRFREHRRSQLRKDRTEGNFLKRKENIVCHGCFMIFSKLFFEYYEGINLHSFMYAEEDILYAQIMSKGLKTVYQPNIVVYHKEGRSVSNSYKNNRKKEMFLLQRYIEANEGYVRYLNELEDNGFTFKKEEK